MRKRADQKKGVFCLEADWGGVRDKTSMEPVLRLLHTLRDYETPYLHHESTGWSRLRSSCCCWGTCSRCPSPEPACGSCGGCWRRMRPGFATSCGSGSGRKPDFLAGLVAGCHRNDSDSAPMSSCATCGSTGRPGSGLAKGRRRHRYVGIDNDSHADTLQRASGPIVLCLKNWHFIHFYIDKSVESRP